MKLTFLCLGVILLPSILSAQSTGLEFESEEVYKSIPFASLPMRGELPGSVDLSPHFPRPGDQGRQGSCVGWAIGYALKGYLEIKERSWSANTKSELLSPAFIYNQIKLEGGGSHMTTALDLLVSQGVATLSDFPYSEKNDSRMPTLQQKQKAREFAIASWRRLSPQKIIDTKTHLASGFPVVIGMQIPTSFKKYRSGVYKPAESELAIGGHAMCVVGYNDSKNAVKIINSWGEKWGMHGYVWVDYQAFTKRVREAYIVQDVIIYHPDKPKPSPVEFDPVPTAEKPWVFPNSSRQKIGNSELRVRSYNELWRARNEIYARHGYIFKSAKGKNYATSLGRHYRPRFSQAGDVEDLFNKVERYNVAIIKAVELTRVRPGKPVDNPWLFADSSMRRLNRSELIHLTSGELWRARNEIFARNGYIFKTNKGKKFTEFMGAIYEPVSSSMETTYANLSSIEAYNVQLIRAVEKLKN